MPRKVIATLAILWGIAGAAWIASFILPRALNFTLPQIDRFYLSPSAGAQSDVPAWIRDLDGKRVALKGFIYCPQLSGSTFELVEPSEFKSYRPEPPQVQGRVFVTMPKGQNVDSLGPMLAARVVGALHVRVHKTAGAIDAVFTIVAQEIKPTEVGLVEVEENNRAYSVAVAMASAAAAMTALVLLISLGSAFSLHLQTREALRGGFCPGCGYDLCATPNRCPECGHSI